MNGGDLVLNEADMAAIKATLDKFEGREITAEQAMAELQIVLNGGEE